MIGEPSSTYVYVTMLFWDNFPGTRAAVRTSEKGAHAGESVTVRGAVATDRSSICQIGPIFVATDVETAPA